MQKSGDGRGIEKIGDAFTDEYLRELWERRDPAAYPYVSVISDGEVLVVYPDDETIRAWNEEGWNVVTVGFSKDRSQLALTRATDDHGVGIRRYPKQRVSVHHRQGPRQGATNGANWDLPCQARGQYVLLRHRRAGHHSIQMSVRDAVQGDERRYSQPHAVGSRPGREVPDEASDAVTFEARRRVPFWFKMPL